MVEVRELETGSPQLRFRIEAGVGVVTLDDPASRNARGAELRPVLRRTLDRVAEDDAIRCLLLTGAGEAFCSGGNAKAMATDEQPPLAERIRAIGWESEASAVIHEMPKPSIAALPGAAAGAARAARAAAGGGRGAAYGAPAASRKVARQPQPQPQSQPQRAQQSCQGAGC